MRIVVSADLTDVGQALEALEGGEAVVHLAAIPSPVHATSDVVFRTNMTSTHAVFAAAVRLGLRRVVWASSETTLGLPFDRPPDAAPVDEGVVRPESSYALSKVLGEEAARAFSRWSGIPFVGLRFSNIMTRPDYDRFPSFWDDPHARKWNLWGYVDESHVVESVERALVADLAGAEVFVIAAADTVMRRPSRELTAEVFPGVPVADAVQRNDTLRSRGVSSSKGVDSRTAEVAAACHHRAVRSSVLIVDDHAGFRTRARALLESEGFDIVGEAVDAASALAQTQQLGPDVVLLDIQLPDADGFEVARRLTSDGDGPVVVLISSREAADFGSLVPASGARGFIAKDELSGARLRSLLA
jgi:nucleoside-diphosphate-sugar epimerase/CheY-like chemotaxis protein